MALTYSPELKKGAHCPSFQLSSVEGKTYSLDSFSQSQILVVMFICAHCPYVQAIEDRYLQLARSYPTQKVQFVGICSNDWEEYPEDNPENLLLRWKEKKYSFPYLIDSSQKVAQSFGAICTPDIFVYNENRELKYRGRLDDSWKDPKKVTHQDLREAIKNLLNQKNISQQILPSMGCSIKWKTKTS